MLAKATLLLSTLAGCAAQPPSTPDAGADLATSTTDWANDWDCDDTWCRPRDIPTALLFTAVFGTSSRDVWVVGGDRAGGRAVHFIDGAPSLASFDLRWADAVWGSSPDAVWLGGPGGIVRWDGVAFTPSLSIADLAIRGLTGTSLDDAWAVGVVDSDPGPDSTLNAAVYHWTGDLWRGTRTGVDVTFYQPSCVFAVSPGDVWMCGFSTTNSWSVYHWSGDAWQQIRSPARTRGLWGSSPADLWLLPELGILRWENEWTAPAGSLGSYEAISGSGPSDAWAVGGGLVHWDGSRWAPLDPASLGPSGSAIWVGPGGDVWIAGGNQILRRRPSAP